LASCSWGKGQRVRKPHVL